MPVYQTHADRPPDDAFEAGALRHLVVGNRGRLLDPRRTPVSITALRPEVGMFVVRIDDFEDRGALWELPFETVDRYQFERGGERADAAQVHAFRAAIERFARLLVIEVDDAQAAATARDLGARERAARAWLDEHSRCLRAGARLPDPETRRGAPLLQGDLRSWMDHRELADIEAAIAAQYVSGPHSGELIKAQAIVLAELGLVPFEGTIIRDPSVLEGAWSRERRGAWTLERLAFIRAAFRALGTERLCLYRGMSVSGPLEPPRNRTFVSATFSRAVAESQFDADPDGTGVLMRQLVHIDRLLMSYLETEQMNRQFLEAEAVLLWSRGAPF